MGFDKSVWQFESDTVENWAYVNNIFTPEECDKIIEIGNSKLKHTGTAGNKINKEIRESQISWLYSDDIEFAFRKVTDAIKHVNNQFFNFDLFGFAEGFQFTCYDAPTGRYEKHIDKYFNGPVRKLSLTIQLSAPEDYEGGELSINLSKNPEFMSKELGKMIVFPSYVLHEVHPVTKGTRYSLVAWVTGKPFK